MAKSETQNQPQQTGETLVVLGKEISAYGDPSTWVDEKWSRDLPNKALVVGDGDKVIPTFDDVKAKSDGKKISTLILAGHGNVNNNSHEIDLLDTKGRNNADGKTINDIVDLCNALHPTNVLVTSCKGGAIMADMVRCIKEGGVASEDGLDRSFKDNVTIITQCTSFEAGVEVMLD